jgi:Arc/MetJ-type ribon-helix-helix transcriptional regulator
MPIMTIRLSRKESARVGRLAKKRRVSRSEVVRQSIQALEAEDTRTALDAWRDVVGIIKGGPTDLSTNPRHMKGYGR